MWKVAMTAAAALLLCIGAWSQESATSEQEAVERVRITDSKEFLRRYDKNRDGKITQSEWTGPAVQFVRMDATGDRVLESWEIRLAHLMTPAQISGFVAERDKDKTGGLSTAELPASATAFGNWDGNGDRQISVGELAAAIKSMHTADRRPMDAEARRAAAQARAANQRPRQVETRESRIRRLWDVDGDGRISRSEFQGSDALWERLDEDGDGFVLPAEITATQSQVRTSLSSRLGGMDKDGDGRISRAEFPGTDETFRQMDRDGDGYLDDKDHPPEMVEITAATPELTPPVEAATEVLSATAIISATEVMSATEVKPATP